uniref:Uncharacterized protein n=1 Tax=Ralstonia solanacearum CFBP2957 TaxID=859656 RepID=D8P6N3_RALSL|nr:protein of unknown function [Ralstonia solanacearum CFBP2957]
MRLRRARMDTADPGPDPCRGRTSPRAADALGRQPATIRKSAYFFVFGYRPGLSGGHILRT